MRTGNSTNTGNNNTRREQIIKLFGKTAGLLDRVCCMSSYQEAQIFGEKNAASQEEEYINDAVTNFAWLSEEKQFTPRTENTSCYNNNNNNNFNTLPPIRLEHYRLHLEQEQQQQKQQLLSSSCQSPGRTSSVATADTATTVTMNTGSPSTAGSNFSDTASNISLSTTVVTGPRTSRLAYTTTLENTMKRMQKENQNRNFSGGATDSDDNNDIPLDTKYSDDDSDSCRIASPTSHQQQIKIRPRHAVPRSWNIDVDIDAEKSIRKIQSESLEQLPYLSATEGYRC